MTEEITPNGKVNYTYHLNGLRASMTPEGGTRTSYTYDLGNRLTRISQAAGSGSTLPTTAQNVTFAYDQADRQTELTLPNGLKINFTWDNVSQLTELKYSQTNGTVLGNLTYGYDAAGQKIRTGGTFAKTEIPTTVSGSVDANNRLTSWAGKNISYDKNGNMASDGTNTYTWNNRNQLVKITGGVTATFTYDVLGRRSSKTVNGVTTKYVYDGHNIVQEKNSSNAVTANLLVGLGLDEWYGRTQRGYSVVYLPDALGSAIGLSGDAQKLIVSYSYEPYGKTTVTGTGNTYGNYFAYTGREDDGTGLYYYRARYYNPAMGRFISEDPIGLAGGPNLYGYVGGNPVQFRDPMGLYDWSGLWNNEPVHGLIILGPIDSIRAAYIGGRATQLANRLSPSIGSTSNGPADAIRHCYWMCETGRAIGVEEARIAGMIHEAAGVRSGYSPESTRMDLHNNEAGLACATNPSVSCEDGCMNQYRGGNLMGINGNFLIPSTNTGKILGTKAPGYLGYY